MRFRRTVALEGMQVLARHLGSAPIEWLLTYANEFVKQEEHGTGDIRAHLLETVDIAAKWMTVNDHTNLKKKFCNAQF